MLQVLKRGQLGLLAVLRRMDGHADFPRALVTAVQERIRIWLQPVYSRSEEEEVGELTPATLQGESVRACVPLVRGRAQRRVLAFLWQRLHLPQFPRQPSRVLLITLQRRWRSASPKATWGAVSPHRWCWRTTRPARSC